jgi:alpha-beta hydrolase superfamily lysophospholipase
MGKRLANEVINFVHDWCPKTLGRLSFIGHSLGGVIIRSALPFLEKYKNQMYTFFTLSSPHLGYMYNSSKVIDAGLWVLSKVRKSICLQQLAMNDAANIKDTFLY